MEQFEQNLKFLNYSKYESKILITLIRYGHLDSKELAKYSKVPRPKIYETIDKLESKGLIEIILISKKKEFKIRPKHILLEKFSYQLNELQAINTQIQQSIESLYSSEKTSEIPIIGVAGSQNIEDYIVGLIDETTSNITLILPEVAYSKHVLEKLKQRSKEIAIKLIFPNDSHLFEKKNQIPDVQFFKFIIPASDTIKNISNNIQKLFSPEFTIANTFFFNLLQDVLDQFDQSYGFVLSDMRKSIFLIPLPIRIPVAIISTLPEVIEFHSNVFTAILNSSQKV